MRRRDFMNVVVGSAVWPLAARSQPADRMRRIGVLMPYANDNSEAQARLAVFLQELKQLGWNVGHNLQIDYRWNTGDPDFGRKAATEMVTLSPDVISRPPLQRWPHCNRRLALCRSYFCRLPIPSALALLQPSRPGGT